MDGAVLGIDIGGTTTSIGFVDREGRLLASTSIPTRGAEPPEALVERIHEQVEGVRGKMPPLQGIGIGAPNANHHKGTLEKVVNLGWGPRVDFLAVMRQRFELPMAITNDAKAAAIGEMMFGDARGLTDFVVITLGTGLGSGFVSGGKVLYGASGFAGELGHTVAVPGGRQCNCGRLGCLETYASATGLRRTVLELLAERNDRTPLRELAYPAITAKGVHEAALAGDPIAQEAFERTGEILGRRLADAVAVTSPEAIFLAGGLAAAGEVLFGPTRRHLERNLFGMYEGTVVLRPSKLEAGASAILGAAALIWTEL